jgi:HPt (histidine-containing phosphotransfer) domain-containing protein
MFAHLSANDIKSFAISVHAMKSELSTIGAMNLSETAFKLETAAKSNDADYCQERFPDFKEKLLILHDKLAAVFPDAKNGTVRKPGDAAYLHESLKKALAAADDFNLDSALDVIHDLLKYDFGGQNNTLLERAASTLENFDYDKARELLNKADE